MMKAPETYKPHVFHLHGLRGISDQTMDMHMGLYKGYVTATNELTEHIFALVKDGKVDHEEMPAYSELTRRLGFEYNGMVLHEHYFGNLMQGGSDRPAGRSIFAQAAENSYGSVELWKADFCAVGMLRGVGWAVCSLNPASRRLSNHWISLHEHGHVAGFIPILVMDVWEHAFLLDYKPSERASYIEAFFSNIDWTSVEKRLQVCEPAFVAAARG